MAPGRLPLRSMRGDDDRVRLGRALHRGRLVTVTGVTISMDIMEKVWQGACGGDTPKAAKSQEELDRAYDVVKAMGERIGVAVYQKDGDGKDVFVRFATQEEDGAFVTLYQTAVGAQAVLTDLLAKAEHQNQTLKDDFESLEADAASVVDAYEHGYCDDIPHRLSSAIENLRDNGREDWWMTSGLAK